MPNKLRERRSRTSGTEVSKHLPISGETADPIPRSQQSQPMIIRQRRTADPIKAVSQIRETAFCYCIEPCALLAHTHYICTSQISSNNDIFHCRVTDCGIYQPHQYQIVSFKQNIKLHKLSSRAEHLTKIHRIFVIFCHYYLQLFTLFVTLPSQTW